MTREIKFDYMCRCDSCGRIVHDVCTLQQVADRSDYDFHEFELCEHADGTDGIMVTLPTRQFTGLHDKNGVEIYEGDIVRLNAVTPGEEVKLVEYINGGFHVSDGEYIAAIFAYASDVPELSRIEVIGNIYENTELMEA